MSTKGHLQHSAVADQSQCEGIGLTAFDRRFDKHFEVRSDRIVAALAGTLDCDAETLQRVRQLPECKRDPQFWGLRVHVLSLLLGYVGEDLRGYVSAHGLDEAYNHVCYADPCDWCHCESATHVPRSKAWGKVRQMRPNMRLVVDRYVKPWTSSQGFEQAGLALVLNAGHMAAKPFRNADILCQATVFISHCWNESFFDFAPTIMRALDPTAVVWVCSFAIWQHGDISAALESLESCPFARAMQTAAQVLVVTDSSAEVFDRCWCILEADLARHWGKPYDMTLPRDDDDGLWKEVAKKLAELDVNECHASVETDKQAILAYAAKHSGGIAALNETVRSMSNAALSRAQHFHTAQEGEVERLLAIGKEELTAWQCIQGRTIIHVLAANSHIYALQQILEAVEWTHLESQDKYGRTPLSVVAEMGVIASVSYLVAHAANVGTVDSRGFTPLYWAIARGHSSSVDCLLRAKSDFSIRARWRGVHGYDAIILASREGHLNIASTLLQHRADLRSQVAGLSSLHLAAREAHSDIVALLLAHMADAGAPDFTNMRRTPLMYAAESGCLAGVSLLVAAKASYSTKDSRGLTCVEYCQAGIASSEVAHAILDCFDTEIDGRIKVLQRPGVSAHTPPPGIHRSKSCSLM